MSSRDGRLQTCLLIGRRQAAGRGDGSSHPPAWCPTSSMLKFIPAQFGCNKIFWKKKSAIFHSATGLDDLGGKQPDPIPLLLQSWLWILHLQRTKSHAALPTKAFATRLPHTSARPPAPPMLPQVQPQTGRTCTISGPAQLYQTRICFVTRSRVSDVLVKVWECPGELSRSHWALFFPDRRCLPRVRALARGSRGALVGRPEASPPPPHAGLLHEGGKTQMSTFQPRRQPGRD